MFFKSILQPALYVMSKLSFKTKIITSILLLFILLLLPSRTLFTDFVEKNKRYNKQLVGLRYIEIIHAFIITAQIHKSISLQILNEDKNKTEVREDYLSQLEENTLKFYRQKTILMEHDQANLKLFGPNQDFAKAIGAFEAIKKEKLDEFTSTKSIFKKYNEIIEKFIKAIYHVSEETKFSSSKDLRINYLAEMLQDKMIHLTHYTRQFKDSTISNINTKQQLKEQKWMLYTIETDLHRLKLFLEKNHLVSELSNYHALEEQITSVTYKVDQLLYILDNAILNNVEQLNNKYILDKASSAIESQQALYTMFNFTYKDTVHKLIEKSEEKLWSLLLLFFGIVIIAFYIFIAFYESITGNIKKLQSASEMIADGKTKIKLKVDKGDEIGDALLAFNTMSEKLSANIAFFDGYKTAIDTSSIVSKTDTRGIITYVNEMFCNVSGYTEKELIGRSHNIIRHEDMPPELFEEMWKTIKSKKIWKGTLKNKHKDGSSYIVNATILPILDPNDNILEYIGVRHDITELENSKEEIKKQRTDLLTGLPNRNQLLVDLKVAVKPIVFYINIDDFSGFNEFYGSNIGDLVLLGISDVLKKFQKIESYELYKLQSDKFILLFEEEQLSNSNLYEFFSELFENIERNISNITIENHNRISLSVTGGVATHYAHDNYQNLILYANIARKKAQQMHKKFLLFDHTMRKNEDYAQNIEWIRKIKEAIDEDRITTYYQGIVDTQTGEVCKYETLARMLDRDQKPVPTFTFLEIAHKAQLYPQITKIVIEKALKTFEHRSDVQFSINLTIEDILSQDMKHFIYKKLENYKNTQNIIFEITESEEVDDYNIINEFIDEVKTYGVKIAIDDFGSGYANFEHIIHINADYIKIDGTLIKNINEDKSAMIITEAIISFSKKLNRQVITEYVHNEFVYQKVKELGADYSQGFYFSKPTPNIK